MNLPVSMLDGEIERLKCIMPHAPYSFSKVERQDWRPFRELSRQIQERFKGIRYPTKQEHDEAWRRFNEIRDEGHRRATEERERFRRQSEEQRDLILSQCSGITWSALTDTLFFFDHTTADQVKLWGRYLGEAMTSLKEHKHEMLAEHKQECFEKFQAIKESHDNFWQQYNEAKQTKNTQQQQRRNEITTRIESNLESNRAKLAKATDALERQRARVDELQAKLEETQSRKWQEIHRTWIVEAEEKIADIEASVKRIEDWIDEDERRLREFADRQRHY